MDGKLIVIDGLDGSGKTTQIQMLIDELRKQYRVKHIKYPYYDKPTGQAIQMYLNGEFSKDTETINTYAAGCLFTADRYVGFKTDWESNYKNGEIIIADRYVSSNLIYQMSKLPKSDWDEYMHWLYDFEYSKMCMPKPCKVIYLDMDILISQRLLTSRYCGDEVKKDIHEININFLKKCREAALYVSFRQDWQVVKCDDGENPLPVEEINCKIVEGIRRII